jgi:alpha-amylase/alpha-mannosidase (GH57 family)
MPTLSFLWHLHQPAYRTADGVAHAPWVLLHAGGAYATLARAIRDTGAQGHVVNIVPTLLEQLIAYDEGLVRDPVAEAITTSPQDLEPNQRVMLRRWAAHVTPRQLARYPRLAELIASTENPGHPGGRSTGRKRSELRDLQVLMVLAQAGEWSWRDPQLAPLHERGRSFAAEHHELVCQWLSEQAGKLIRLWRELAGRSGVEIATSPYAHPIMPLLIDTNVVRDSWVPHEPPSVPPFQHSEDARQHLAQGLGFMRRHGFDPIGCWPPEGAVSNAAVELYGSEGVRWLVSDEGILERSLSRSIRPDGDPAPELYRPWTLGEGSPALFFRDRQLSDRIGFVYGQWDDESYAAPDFKDHLEQLARELPDDAAIVVALDGENPWLHYSNGGGVFLRSLFSILQEDSINLVPATLGDLSTRLEPSALSTLHPGSWINSVFATWIGHPEKTRAWELLSEIRRAMPEGELPPSMLLAEGSDWFWWLGEDNPTELAPLYDEIFRRHLADACRQAGIDVPAVLDRPLKRVE